MSDVSNSFSAWETLPGDEPPLCIAVRRPVSPPRHYEAVCLLLVIVFFIDGRIQGAYSMIYVFAFLLAFGCILTLLILYFEVPKMSKQVPWLQVELFWNVLGCVLCAAGCILLTWDWWEMQSGRIQYHSRLAPKNIAETRWMRRVAIVAGSLLLASCLFLFTLARVKRTGIH